MPICQPCRDAIHGRCDDNRHARLNRGCYCQHRVIGQPENHEREQGNHLRPMPSVVRSLSRDEDAVSDGAFGDVPGMAPTD